MKAEQIDIPEPLPGESWDQFTRRAIYPPRRKYPILRGRVVDNSLLFVYCPWCDREHQHGYDPKDGLRPTHRAAHCSPNSPFRERGYMVAPFRKKDVSHHRSTSPNLDAKGLKSAR